MIPSVDIFRALAVLLLAGVPFVGVALWVRRRLGPVALVVLWLVAALGVATLQQASMGPALAPDLQRPRDAIVAQWGALFFIAALSFGAACLAVHRAACTRTPTTLGRDFLVPLVSFAVAHAMAVGLLLGVILVLAERHAP